MVNAPRWCLIMSLRKSRSNSVARAPSSRSISSSVSMPGISSASPVRDGRSSGTCWPRERSHSRIIWISSAWESSMRLASWRIVSRSLREASCSVISIAWAWWAIIPCMNFTSASVNRIPARSEASSGEIDRLGSPGRTRLDDWRLCLAVRRNRQNEGEAGDNDRGDRGQSSRRGRLRGHRVRGQGHSGYPPFTRSKVTLYRAVEGRRILDLGPQE